MTEQPDLPVEAWTCPYPGCTVEVVEGTGATCSPEHQRWFNDAIANCNAGIPPMFAAAPEEEASHAADDTVNG